MVLWYFKVMEVIFTYNIMYNNISHWLHRPIVEVVKCHAQTVTMEIA